MENKKSETTLIHITPPIMSIKCFYFFDLGPPKLSERIIELM